MFKRVFFLESDDSDSLVKKPRYQIDTESDDSKFVSFKKNSQLCLLQAIFYTISYCKVNFITLFI